MNSNIKIKEHWLTAGRQGDIKKYIISRIDFINQLQDLVYAAREVENDYLKQIDAETKNLKLLEGIIFDFVEVEKQPKREIKNDVNILIKGLDNTKI